MNTISLITRPSTSNVYILTSGGSRISGQGWGVSQRCCGGRQILSKFYPNPSTPLIPPSPSTFQGTWTMNRGGSRILVGGGREPWMLRGQIDCILIFPNKDIGMVHKQVRNTASICILDQFRGFFPGGLGGGRKTAYERRGLCTSSFRKSHIVSGHVNLRLYLPIDSREY